MNESRTGAWMHWARRWLLPSALAAAISMAAVAVISAAEYNHKGERAHGVAEHRGERITDHGAPRHQGGHIDRLAELLGTDADGLKSALQEGSTLAEIAEANGIDAQTVIDALVEQADEYIALAVESGKLSQEEAVALVDQVAAQVEEWVTSGAPEDHWSSRVKSGTDALRARVDEFASLLGTDLDGLKAALGSGQSLAEIAESNDVDPQTVTDALVEKATDRIDVVVELGRLSNEQAETIKTTVEEKITQRVSEGRPERAKRAGNRFGNR